MVSCLFVGLGGFAGAVLRYLVGKLPLSPESGFPVKTLLINIVGSFVIGLITALALKQSNLSANLILFLKVGICGGFTTFSTFALESTTLLQEHKPLLAIVYIVLSVVLSICAVFLAEGLAGRR